MTAQKAVEILTINNDHNPNFTDAEREEAHQLGIQALTLYTRSRTTQPVWLPLLLPSETED